MLRAPEFTSASQSDHTWRAARRWLAMSAALLSHPQEIVRTEDQDVGQNDLLAFPANAIRFGLVVSRRHERRAVARNMVKRILRESARHFAPALASATGERRVDVVLRLKAPLPRVSDASWSEVKAVLRREADDLLAQLRAQLARQDAPPAGRR